MWRKETGYESKNESDFSKIQVHAHFDIFLFSCKYVCGVPAALTERLGRYDLSLLSGGMPACICVGAVFGKELICGRYFIKNGDYVCLLDRDTARKLFGSENVLGMEVRIIRNG